MDNKIIEPFGHQILVSPRTVKRILVSDANKLPLCEYGDVIAIGQDVKYIKVGDVIGHTVWGVNKLEVNDKTYYFIPEDSRFVLAKLHLS